MRGVGIAVLGLGEAGREIARDLVAAGARVGGYDPRPDRTAPPGAKERVSGADAVAGAEVVLSANSASDAEEALRSGLPAAVPGAVWADLNTAAPALKRRLAGIAEQGGVAFADVADVDRAGTGRARANARFRAGGSAVGVAGSRVRRHGHRGRRTTGRCG